MNGDICFDNWKKRDNDLYYENNGDFFKTSKILKFDLYNFLGNKAVTSKVNIVDVVFENELDIYKFKQIFEEYYKDESDIRLLKNIAIALLIIDPDETYGNLLASINVAICSNNYDLAEKFINVGIAFFPLNWRFHFLKALCLFRNGEYETSFLLVRDLLNNINLSILDYRKNNNYCIDTECYFENVKIVLSSFLLGFIDIKDKQRIIAEHHTLDSLSFHKLPFKIYKDSGSNKESFHINNFFSFQNVIESMNKLIFLQKIMNQLL